MGQDIVVIGDCMLDKTWYCDCKRLSPEAPVPVAELSFKVSVPGGAGNVVRNIKKIGAQETTVWLCSALSSATEDQLTDEYQVCVWEGSKALSPDQENIKFRIVDYQTGYHLVRVDNERFIQIDKAQLNIASLLYFLKSVKPSVIILSDYLKGIVSPELSQAVIHYARTRDSIVLVDSRSKDPISFMNADLITPNNSEYQNILATFNIQTPQEVIEKLQLRLGLLLTKSKDGLVLYTTDGQCISSPAVGKHVVDVTGAGDTVLATIATALSAGYKDWHKILTVANELAYDVCMQRGTAVPKRKITEFQWE